MSKKQQERILELEQLVRDLETPRKDVSDNLIEENLGSVVFPSGISFKINKIQMTAIGIRISARADISASGALTRDYSILDDKGFPVRNGRLKRDLGVKTVGSIWDLTVDLKVSSDE